MEPEVTCSTPKKRVEPNKEPHVKPKKCSKILFSVGRPRTRSSTTIRHLPVELLVRIFSRFHIRDLLNVEMVCKDFRNVISSQSSLWANVSFRDVWPRTKSTLEIFTRASKHHNFEAVLKLGIAKLYNLSPQVSVDDENFRRISMEAMAHFQEAELITGMGCSFTWALIRPPWVESQRCCKSTIYKSMKTEIQAAIENELSSDTKIPSNILPYVATVYMISRVNNDEEGFSVFCYLAAEFGLPEAKIDVFKSKYQGIAHHHWKKDPGVRLQAMRELREIADSGHFGSKMLLAFIYYSGEYGGFSQLKAAAYTRKLFQTPGPSVIALHKYTHAIRYILVDWMADVCDAKGYSCPAFTSAVAVVDRCMDLWEIKTSRLQLLAIAAIVLIGRSQNEPSMITIREAAWFTDNTYTYDDVVMMMGEILTALKGNLTIPTAFSYSYVFNLEGNIELMVMYILELSLLHSDICLTYSQPLIAVAAIVIARILLEERDIFPTRIEQMTGFRKVDICECVLFMYTECFLATPLFTGPEQKQLVAVKERNTPEEGADFDVTKVKILSEKAFVAKLRLKKYEAFHLISSSEHNLRTKARNLIQSPTRGSRAYSFSNAHDVSREDAGTPTPDESFSFCVLDLEEEEDSDDSSFNSANTSSCGEEEMDEDTPARSAFRDENDDQTPPTSTFRDKNDGETPATSKLCDKMDEASIIDLNLSTDSEEGDEDDSQGWFTVKPNVPVGTCWQEYVRIVSRLNGLGMCSCDDCIDNGSCDDCTDSNGSCDDSTDSDLSCEDCVDNACMYDKKRNVADKGTCKLQKQSEPVSDSSTHERNLVQSKISTGSIQPNRLRTVADPPECEEKFRKGIESKSLTGRSRNRNSTGSVQSNPIGTVADLPDCEENFRKGIESKSLTAPSRNTRSTGSVQSNPIGTVADPPECKENFRKGIESKSAAAPSRNTRSTGSVQPNLSGTVADPPECEENFRKGIESKSVAVHSRNTRSTGSVQSNLVSTVAEAPDCKEKFQKGVESQSLGTCSRKAERKDQATATFFFSAAQCAELPGNYETSEIDTCNCVMCKPDNNDIVSFKPSAETFICHPPCAWHGSKIVFLDVPMNSGKPCHSFSYLHMQHKLVVTDLNSCTVHLATREWMEKCEDCTPLKDLFEGLDDAAAYKLLSSSLHASKLHAAMQRKRADLTKARLTRKRKSSESCGYPEQRKKEAL